jgi:hypothetical protein
MSSTNALKKRALPLMLASVVGTGVSLSAIAGGINADPVVLSDAQMDEISAGQLEPVPAPTIPPAYGPGGNGAHGVKVGNAVGGGYGANSPPVAQGIGPINNPHINF